MEVGGLAEVALAGFSGLRRLPLHTCTQTHTCAHTYTLVQVLSHTHTHLHSSPLLSLPAMVRFSCCSGASKLNGSPEDPTTQ